MNDITPFLAFIMALISMVTTWVSSGSGTTSKAKAVLVSLILTCFMATGIFLGNYLIKFPPPIAFDVEVEIFCQTTINSTSAPPPLVTDLPPGYVWLPTPTWTYTQCSTPFYATKTVDAHYSKLTSVAIQATIDAATDTPTATYTHTPTPTSTYTPVPTISPEPTETPTFTPSPTLTLTPLPTKTFLPSPTPPLPCEIQATLHNTVNIREKPSLEAAIVGTLKPGDKIYAIAKSSDEMWWKVELAPDKIGWIKMNVVSAIEPINNFPGNCNDLLTSTLEP